MESHLNAAGNSSKLLEDKIYGLTSEIDRLNMEIKSKADEIERLRK